jgi:hypothetical protein
MVIRKSSIEKSQLSFVTPACQDTSLGAVADRIERESAVEGD